MRVHGYCRTCHRFRPVRPETRLLASGVVMGECMDCEDKRNAPREPARTRSQKRRDTRRRQQGR